MELSTALVISSIKNCQPVFVLGGFYSLPSQFALRGQIVYDINHLLKHITGVEAYDEKTGSGWGMVRLNHLHETEDGAILVYSVILPEAIKLADNWFWKDSTIFDKLDCKTKNILLKAMLTQ